MSSLGDLPRELEKDRELDKERCANCATQLNNPDGTSRVIGVEIWGVYDGILYWTCPDCDFAWVRVFGMPSRDALSEQHALIHNQLRIQREEK